MKKASAQIATSKGAVTLDYRYKSRPNAGTLKLKGPPAAVALIRALLEELVPVYDPIRGHTVHRDIKSFLWVLGALDHYIRSGHTRLGELVNIVLSYEPEKLPVGVIP